MSSSAALAAAPSGIQAISSLGNAYSQSQALKAQALYQQGILNVNATFAEFQAKDSIERGEIQAAEIERMSKRDLKTVKDRYAILKGKQRTTLSAQGIEINSGSAAEILAETDRYRDLDENEIKTAAAKNILTTKNNAWMEAWGYKQQALGFGFKGRMAEMAGDTASRNTLLAGGLSAVSYGLDSYSRYRSTK